MSIGIKIIKISVSRKRIVRCTVDQIAAKNDCQLSLFNGISVKVRNFISLIPSALSFHLTANPNGRTKKELKTDNVKYSKIYGLEGLGGSHFRVSALYMPNRYPLLSQRRFFLL